MIRTVNTDDIVKNIKEMCIEANHYLSKDMDKALKEATASEKSELGKKILNQLQENLKIADEEMIPICQDTGMAVIFLEVAGRVTGYPLSAYSRRRGPAPAAEAPAPWRTAPPVRTA